MFEEQTPEVPPAEGKDLESSESPREMLRERPFLSRRPPSPRDTVVPRGVNGIHRVPPGSVVSRHYDNASSESEPRPVSHFRTDRQIQGGGANRGPKKPYGYRRPYGNPSGGYRSEGGRPRNEPLSLAEELAEEMSRGHRVASDSGNAFLNDPRNSDSVAALQRMSAAELIAEARRFDIPVLDEEHLRKQDLVFQILKEKIKLNGLMYGEGTLEILPDGFGFLRSMDYHYVSCPDDIYVSPSQIRRFGLKTGSIISGQIRPPKENERYFALLRVEAINYRDPNEFSRKKHFDDLTPILPSRKLTLESGAEELDTRVLDMMVPMGFGQRGLVVSPPQAGKSTLIQKIARSAMKNHPELYVFVLLIDERPEEVTDMKRQVSGPNCEVISSTFDELPTRHLQVAEMVLEKAKRMVEYGQDVMILLDSLTRLARAWNAESQAAGKVPPDVADPAAVQMARAYFGSARSVEEGGSLTLLATALTNTGSPLDERFYDAFKGTGNLEIVLDRRLAEQSVWPAVDLTQSGTLHEDVLRSEEEQTQVAKLRRLLCELNPVDAMEMLTRRLSRTANNAEYLASLS
ncbi:MAG: transcription termination factor Rho [Planctomycetia bacterium]|nr:transcription termination factor Rho [Planctomycetia bacterium]